MTIDWTELAQRLGSIRESGNEHSGTELARTAVEQLTGEEIYISAVDHYVKGAPGAELARSVLWLIHPWSAMQRCHQLYLHSDDIQVRRSAIELLRVVADRRALPWINLYLTDRDEQIQSWAAGIVDQLLFSDLADVHECASLLQAMAAHENESVRERYAFIVEENPENLIL